MLTDRSPWVLHLAQNAALILISLLLIPISNTLLILSYLARPFLSSDNAARNHIRRSPNFRPRTVLVTGVGMTKGLMLARTFYLAGHNVIGADFQTYGIPVCGRYSKALKKFYPLPKPNPIDGSTHYVQELLRIVQQENIELWVSCSGVASAIEDGQAKEILERRTDCKCIQFSVTTTQTLHEKHTFISQTAALGLPVPETHNVTSRAAVHRVLHESPRTKKRYIMKSVDMDDAVRGDMTILPRRTMSETYTHLSTIPISDKKPWVLQQFISGGREYCTHALIVNNRVLAFLACPSLELLMHYSALPPDSALNKAMLRFTQEFAGRFPEQGFTGHLSFDFLVEERVSEKGAELCLEPIECNPRAHTAVCLFQGKEVELAERYLEVLKPQINGYTEDGESAESAIEAEDSTTTPLTPLPNPPSYYWLGHDIVTLLLLPLLSLIPLPNKPFFSPLTYLKSINTFLTHLLWWKDGTWELWDPLPMWWLYHIYWPGQFLASMLTGRKWSRVNVGTTKMFGC
ncbi:hypothetical protein ACLMJK_009341 [Lecanora helva]